MWRASARTASRRAGSIGPRIDECVRGSDGRVDDATRSRRPTRQRSHGATSSLTASFYCAAGRRAFGISCKRSNSAPSRSERPATSSDACMVTSPRPCASSCAASSSSCTRWIDATSPPRTPRSRRTWSASGTFVDAPRKGDRSARHRRCASKDPRGPVHRKKKSCARANKQGATRTAAHAFRGVAYGDACAERLHLRVGMRGTVVCVWLFEHHPSSTEGLAHSPHARRPR